MAPGMRAWIASIVLATAGALAGCVDSPDAPVPDEGARTTPARPSVADDAVLDRVTMEPPVIDLTRLGDACDDLGACPAGTTCVTYYGVGGPATEPMSSCEVTCDRGDPPCPDGTACVRLTDGPGSVCRPRGP